MIGKGVAQALDNRRFELILLPTEKCNFRCVYCYEDFKIGRMAPQVVTGVKRLIDRRLPDLSFLSMSWFGGEPLLAIDIIEDISAHVQEAASGLPVRFGGHVTTNGWMLNAEKVARLLKVAVNAFQVTLDGPSEQHNKTRILASGAGSFDRIYSNLLTMRLLEQDFNVNIRLHLTGDNYAHIEDFMRRLADDFGHDTRFDVSPELVKNLGGDSVKRVSLLDSEGCHGVEQQVKNVFYQHAGREAPPDINIGYVCYAAKANSLLIRPDGRIGKCTVDLYNERNVIGRLDEEGRAHIDNNRLGPWVRGLSSQDADELKCPLSSIATYMSANA